MNRTGVVSVSVSAPPKKPKISQTTQSAVDSAANQNAPMRPRSARLKTQETPYPGGDSRTSSRAGRNAFGTGSSNDKPKTKMSAITAAKLKEKEEKEALRNRKSKVYNLAIFLTGRIATHQRLRLKS